MTYVSASQKKNNERASEGKYIFWSSLFEQRQAKNAFKAKSVIQMQTKEFAHCPLETLLLPLYISTTLYTMQQSNYQRCEQDTKLNSKRSGFQVQGQN